MASISDNKDVKNPLDVPKFLLEDADPVSAEDDVKEDNVLKKLEETMNDDSYRIGYCEHHDEPITQGTFEYKGCWTCWRYFRYENWPYLDSKEASEQYGVSVKTIYRLIRQGKIKARLFIMGRRNLNVPKKFYAIIPNQPRPR